jgi:tetratricopeptide (TPR) repeat protein
VLDVGAATLGGEHPTILATKNNLADMYRAQQKYAQAETLYKQVLEIETAQLGADHPSTLNTKNNLAALYASQRKDEQAESLYLEVLKGQTAKLGAEHPGTLATLNNLAALYWKTKKLDRSVPLLEAAVKGRTKILGAAHPDTLMTLANLGVNYRDAGQVEDGIRCLEDALAGVRRFPGPLPTKLAWIPGEMAATYDGAKQFAKSEPIYREFLQQGRRHFGDADVRSANLMALLGQNLLAQQKHAEAETMLRECLAVREREQPDGWATFNTKSTLGAALLGRKKYADAEPLLLAGYEGMKSREKAIPPPGKVRIPEAIERLVQLYDATDRKDEAAKWQKILENQVGKLVGPVHEVGEVLELRGNLDKQTSALIYQVKLAAGKTYVIDMVSPDQKSLDPYLVLSDTAGKKLAEDDDGGGGLNARIVFRAEQNRIFHIRATSFNGSAGVFILTVREKAYPPNEKKN